MSKIKSIRVSNLRNVNHYELPLEGCTAIIIGGNNKGKSTICKALIDRFRGIKNENIVRVDQIDGRYEMHLTTGEVIIWNINNEGKESLTIITDKKREKVTKEMMQYYFPNGFEVDKFLNDGPLKQQKTLQTLSGLDFTDVDKRYKEDYENRTYYNKRFKEEQAKQIKFEPHWISELRTTADLEMELENISLHNSRYETVKNKLADKQLQLKITTELIHRLRDQIKSEEENLMQLETEIDKGIIWLNDEEKKPKTDQYKQSIKARIEDIKQNNLAIEKEMDLARWEQHYNEANEMVKKVLADKEEMIRLADMPEGFGFSEEGITYNGVPYDKKNQSTSALYIGALKLAARVIGEVKCIHFDACPLDKNGLEQVQEWAENNNLQLLIERPDWNGGEIHYEIIED